MWKFLIYFTCVTLINSKLTETTEVLKCAIEVANENFIYRKSTIIISSDTHENYANHFLKEYKGSVLVEVNNSAQVGQVVFITDTYQSFVNILSKLRPDLKRNTVLNSGAKFLIILLTNQDIERINRFFWNYFVLDIVIVIKRKDTVELFTYFPYSKHLDCTNTKPTLVGYWNTSHKPKTIYGNKLNNMNGCPLYISTNKINYPLADKTMPLEIINKSIIRAMRDIVNFTAIITSKEYINIDSIRAKNWSDSLSDVLSGAANISTCSIPLGVDVLSLLDYSMPCFRVQLAWIAPPSSPGPGWWRLLTPLNGYLWLLLLVAIFIVKSIPFVMRIKPVKNFCYRYFKHVRYLKGTVFKIWAVMVGQPVQVAPKRFRDFYIIGLWLWFTFIVRSVYQSVLIGALKTDSVTGNFANLNEAIEEGYQIGGRAGIYSHFENDPLISERFIVIQEQHFEDVIDGNKKFVLATSLEHAYAYCLAHEKKDKECGNTLPDTILSVPLVFWIKKRSPFSIIFNRWLPRIIESGILNKNDMMKIVYVSEVCSEPTPAPLTRHQMLSILCLSSYSYLKF